MTRIHHLPSVGALLMLAIAGCGGNAGVDAEMATKGGPKMRREINVEERVQLNIKWLEEAEPDEATNHNILQKMLSLVAAGAAAEPALPVLEKIQQEWPNEDVRDAATNAINKIQDAVDQKGSQ